VLLLVTIAQRAASGGLALSRWQAMRKASPAVVRCHHAQGVTALHLASDNGADGDEELTSLRVGFPPRSGAEVTHSDRVYNVWIGGKGHYPADRKAAAKVAACRPQAVAAARANRAFDTGRHRRVYPGEAALAAVTA
jgi:hypothetical protein